MVAEDKKEIEPRLNFPAKLKNTLIHTDRLKLKTILDHLIQNAVRFTESGTIELGVKMLIDNKLYVYVLDTGFGIDKDIVNSIIKPFVKGDKAYSERGVGIGLTIIKGLIDLLGGTLSINSTLDTGSEFVIEIPVEFHQVAAE